MTPPNMPFWQKDYFELIILGNSRHRRNSENKSWSFVREIYIIKGLSPCEGTALSVQKRKAVRSQEDLTTERADLNQHSNSHPYLPLFSVKLP